MTNNDLVAAIEGQGYRLTAPRLRVLESIAGRDSNFTAEEVWSYMPPGSVEEKSVHMSSFPEVPDVGADEGFINKWEMLTELKGEVSKALELCRQEKVIGHSLDARVSLVLPEKVCGALNNEFSDLRFIFIVSGVEVVSSLDGDEKVYSSENIEGLKIGVRRMGGRKCERCWNYFTEEVSEKEEHTAVCSRCVEKLESAKA
ncbi:MAG: hypothetical protein IID18_09620 [Nitrospinae bacterium]|nr:hypothetical protein [Nitrospinota bacterium]